MIKADSERLKKIYLNATSLQQYIKDNKIDKLVHDYEGTNWSIVVEVIYNELPEFIKKIKDLI